MKDEHSHGQNSRPGAIMLCSHNDSGSVLHDVRKGTIDGKE